MNKMSVAAVCVHTTAHLNTATPTTNHTWYVAVCSFESATKKHAEILINKVEQY